MKSNEEFKAAIMGKKDRHYARRRSAVKKFAAAASAAACCAALLFGGIHLRNSGLFNTMTSQGDEKVSGSATENNSASPEEMYSETAPGSSAEISLFINRDGEEDRISLTWDQAEKIADKFEKTALELWDCKEEISATERVYALEFGGKSYIFSNLGTLVIDGRTFFLSAEQADALSRMLESYE